MGNIIGEPFKEYIQKQIEVRQKVHGAKERTNEQLQYLNTRNTWIKLASAVSLDERRISYLQNKGNVLLNDVLTGKDLATKYVLFNGVSQYENVAGGVTGKSKIREGIGSNGAYGIGRNDFGYSPMPGIIDADIKALNRGSLKKATVNIKAYNKDQFDIIDTLYLRLGYTVCLEWGYDKYIDNNGKLQNLTETLIDNEFWKSRYDNSDYSEWLPRIEENRKKYDGNYDGILGVISNFSWTFEDDGSYSIKMEIMSLGDVIESLKVNVPPKSNDQINNNGDKNILVTVGESFFGEGFIDELEAQVQQDEINEESDLGFLYLLEQNKNKNRIWRWFYDLRIVNASGEEIEAARNKKTNEEIQSALKASQVNDDITIEWKNGSIPATLIGGILNPNKNSLNPINDNINKWNESPMFPKYDSENESVDYIRLDVLPAMQSYHVRLGTLLDFLNNEVIPKIASSNKKPIITIDTDVETNICYTIDNVMSLDLRKGVIRNDSFYNGTDYDKLFVGLNEFFKVIPINIAQIINNPNSSSSGYTRYGKLMNVYLNIKNILDIVDKNTDEEGNINLYEFLSSICNEINLFLGGINNIEPVIDEESNIIRLIDQTPIPNLESIKVYINETFNKNLLINKKEDVKIQIYGYKQNKDISNFVRNVGIKTQIDKNYANMITIGATSNGAIPGTESTAFARWNIGIGDRLKNKIIDAASFGTGSLLEQNIAVIDNYKKFIALENPKIGFDDSDSIKINPEIIDQNIANATDFYTFAQSWISTLNEDPNNVESSVGFLPFNLTLEMDGLSGIKIYQKLNVSTDFLPSNYPDSLKFVVTKVDHKLSNNDWILSIDTIATINNELNTFPINTREILRQILETKVLEVINKSKSILNTSQYNQKEVLSGIPSQNTNEPTPNADKLRRVLNGLGYKEKLNEISSGGDITEEMYNYASSLFQKIKNTYPNISITVTGGNDFFHKKLSYASRHSKGRGLDFVISPSNQTDITNVENILKSFAAGNYPYARYLNEYTNPTKAASGKHFHISWGKGTEAQTNIDKALAEADNGNIPKFII